MSSDGDEKKTKLALGATLAGGALDQVIPGAGTAMTFGMGSIGLLLRKSIERRYQRWLQDIAATQEFGSEAELAAELLENVDEPWVHEGVLQSLRAMLDIVDEAAIPSLTALAADYLYCKTAPDSFYKRCARVLADSHSRDLVVLARLLEGVLAVAPDEGTVDATGPELSEGWTPVSLTSHPDPCASDERSRELELPGGRTMQQVMRRLEAQDFARPTTTRDPYRASLDERAPLVLGTHFSSDQLADLRRFAKYVRAEGIELPDEDT
jgi:hypothetical protein